MKQIENRLLVLCKHMGSFHNRFESIWNQDATKSNLKLNVKNNQNIELILICFCALWYRTVTYMIRNI